MKFGGLRNHRSNRQHPSGFRHISRNALQDKNRTRANTTLQAGRKSQRMLDAFRKYIKAERESLAAMDKEEIKDFLDYLQKLGEC
jgi:vacuolar-type H+-ATPase subunit H